jgi:hypothetical protein
VAGAIGKKDQHWWLFIRSQHMVSGRMPRHMYTMANVIYDVFVQRDGNYGVALSLRGAMVRTTPDFASESDARAWVAQDQRLERTRNTERELDAAVPRARSDHTATARFGLIPLGTPPAGARP